MITEKSFKSSYDGLDIYYLSSIPEENIKGVVEIAHGMCEHKERYAEFMEYLSSKGYASYAIDHRGHGKSVRNIDDLGYLYDDKGEAIVEDVYGLTLIIRSEHPDLPIYLFGHSMGSLVVRKYLQKHDKDIDKLIVCGSPSENKMASMGIIVTDIIKVFKGDHYRSSLVNGMALGANDRKFAGKNSWLSLNEDNVRRYNEDSMCGFTFTLNGFRNLFILMRDTYDASKYQMNNPELDILFIAGEDDPVIVSGDNFNNAVLFLNKTGYQHTQKKLYPKLRHEILNENSRYDIFEDIVRFIEK